MRLVFGQRQLESNVAVDMAVGQVMNDLSHGPTTFAIGRVELLIAQSAHGFAKIRRMRGDLPHEFFALRSVKMRVKVRLADGIARIDCSGSHGGSISLFRKGDLNLQAAKIQRADFPTAVLQTCQSRIDRATNPARKTHQRSVALIGIRSMTATMPIDPMIRTAV